MAVFWRPARPAKKPVPTAQTKPRRILVVDDEPLIRWSLRECLSAQGYEVVDADTAHEALERFAEGVDLVLLDNQLPDQSGLEVAGTIAGSSRACPVILMTAHGDAELRRKAGERHVLTVVDKPFDVPSLIELLGRALPPTSVRPPRRRPA
jgi:DNA-binding NtrC family response regulator